MEFPDQKSGICQDRNFRMETNQELTMAQKKTGAVMVVGGGITGMQAALDLAGSGLFVYLVERTSSIGGMMSQLDKTFPTNDCAM
jgi:heterodisulfide reductase subunit A-like polyferredoxin